LSLKFLDEEAIQNLISLCCFACLCQCHHMLEENEELLEHWWFNSYAKGQDEDLNVFLCQSTLKGD